MYQTLTMEEMSVTRINLLLAFFPSLHVDEINMFILLNEGGDYAQLVSFEHTKIDL